MFIFKHAAKLSHSDSFLVKKLAEKFLIFRVDNHQGLMEDARPFQAPRS
jgi:hypothetical protein